MSKAIPVSPETYTKNERDVIAKVRLAIEHGDVDAARWWTAAHTGIRAGLREALWDEALRTWQARAEGGAT